MMIRPVIWRTGAIAGLFLASGTATYTAKVEDSHLFDAYGGGLIEQLRQTEWNPSDMEPRIAPIRHSANARSQSKLRTLFRKHYRY